MRNRSRCAFVFAGFLALGAVTAQAQITGLAIDPPFPGSHDLIHLTVSGQAPLCSLPVAATVMGPNTILVSITPCPVDPPSPNAPFAASVTVGPLRAGNYTVEVDGGSFSAPLTVSDPPSSPLFDSLFFGRQRFEVSLVWNTPILAGRGVPEALTDNAGYFWFFDPSNPEVLVKLIDGTAVNGHFWVFLGGLSDVGYTVVITDRATDRVRTYTNSPGTVTSRADTAAF